jgi:hypothetical protein
MNQGPLNFGGQSLSGSEANTTGILGTNCGDDHWHFRNSFLHLHRLAPTSTLQCLQISTDVYRPLSPTQPWPWPIQKICSMAGQDSSDTILSAYMPGSWQGYVHGGTETKRDRYWNDWLTKSPVPRRLPVREPKNCNSKAIQRTWTSENVNQL